MQRPVQPAVERPTERERPFEIVGHLSINRHKVVPLGREWIRNIPVPVNLFTLDGNKDGLSLAAENNNSTLSRRPIYRNDLPKFIEKD